MSSTHARSLTLTPVTTAGLRVKLHPCVEFEPYPCGVCTAVSSSLRGSCSSYIQTTSDRLLCPNCAVVQRVQLCCSGRGHGRSESSITACVVHTARHGVHVPARITRSCGAIDQYGYFVPAKFEAIWSSYDRQGCGRLSLLDMLRLLWDKACLSDPFGT